MTDTIAHRGPDDSGEFIDPPLFLGFRRLAIFDLSSAGHQPMVSHDGRYVIAFNGAIYNYLDLRRELEGHGANFRSGSDTEVLLAAYQRWGTACLPRLNGMWAFVIWDRTERRMFGARDRFGVKPLFYREGKDFLAFASEIKALRDPGLANPSIDWGTLSSFLVDGSLDAGSETFFEDIRRVPAGSAFEVSQTGELRCFSYWSLAEASASIVTEPDPCARLAALLDDSVSIRMLSDVPVGALLSGGLDSTSIVCAMARNLDRAGRRPDDLLAFTFQSPQFDETAYVTETLKQTGARLMPTTVNPLALWSSLERHLWHHDEPVHSMTSLVVDHLISDARSSGVKVLLNGQGADELLAGYPSYVPDYWSELIRAGRLTRLWAEFATHRRAQGRSTGALLRRALTQVAARVSRRIPGRGLLSAALAGPRTRGASWFSDRVVESSRRRVNAADGSLSDALQWSIEKAMLPLYLRVEDRNSMAHGVEVRLPFLDFRLASFAFGLGSEWKLRDGVGKFALREAMRGRIPEVVRSRKDKLGFPIPIDDWFRNELCEPVFDLLTSRSVRESGLWNMSNVVAAFERHRRGEIDVALQLFQVAQTSLWMEAARSPPARIRHGI